jgi:flavodoxin
VKTAVIYYSYEGNCAMIAECVKAALDADLVPLIPVDEKRRKGLAKYFWGGKQVLMSEKPPLWPYSLDTDLYDLIIIGTPVWAGTFTPALASFFAETKITNKKVALFCCHRGGKGRVFEKMKNALPGNTFLGEADFISPLKHEKSARDKLAQWLQTLTQGTN